MKLLISIASDIIATKRFKSKQNARRSMNRVLRAPRFSKVRHDSCELEWMGRRYCKAELQDAIFVTPNEFFKLHLTK